MHLQTGAIDEAIYGITESLRIAQNNQDEICINQCLMQLAQIASLLGNYEEEIMMTEKALHHCFKLKKPSLFLMAAI